MCPQKISKMLAYKVQEYDKQIERLNKELRKNLMFFSRSSRQADSEMKLILSNDLHYIKHITAFLRKKSKHGGKRCRE